MKTRKMTLTGTDLSILGAVLEMPGLGIQDFHKGAKLLDLIEGHLLLSREPEFLTKMFTVEMEIPVANWAMTKLRECRTIRLRLAPKVIALVETLAGKETEEK